MERVLTPLGLGLLLLVALGCGTADNPVSKITEIETTTGALRGKVQPIDGVSFQFRLLKDGQLVAQTEGDDDFVLRKIEAGDYTLRISAQGYQKTELNVTVIVGETVSLDEVVLVELAEPVSQLHGLLRNARTGIRLRKVLITLSDEAGKEYETLTTNEGVFTFENLPTLQTFILTVKYADYKQYELTVEPIPANETVKLYIKLTPLVKARELEPLEPGEGLRIHSDAPEFELPDGNGVLHTLADYLEDGKKVVLVFYWGSG